MMTWRRGVVRAIRGGWSGATELLVEIPGEGTAKALAYERLVGQPKVGDDVLLNTTALALGLGTGGYALVVALPGRLPAEVGGPGHLVKGRYTPMQATVFGVDEQESPYFELLRDADDLAGMPVVVADLHSALAPLLVGIRTIHPDARVAYVMTDGGSLPIWFSRTVATLRHAGWLAGTVTVGQAFGGDYDAVTLHTGLLTARLVMDADLAIVTQGPGNLGTGTRWGFSGVACGEAINAAAVLGGRAVAALRISGADPRERHRGISHHSLTAYGRVALAPADVVVPDLGGDLGDLVRDQVRSLAARHRIVVEPVDGLATILQEVPAPIGRLLSTMGRGLAEDVPYFVASAAAGRYSARLVASADG